MVVEFSDVGVAAVASQRVLNEVVGADGEEVYILSEYRRHYSSSRSLNHDTNLYVFSVSLAFMSQFQLSFFDEFLNLLEFCYVDDHRHHDANFAVYTSAQNSLQLRQEEVLALQADADCTVAQERVFFFRNVEVRQRFVTADIHGTDNAEVALALFNSFFVSLELVFFIGDILTAHEYELRTEQAYALGAILEGVIHVHMRADVGHEVNLHAVRRNSGQVFKLSVMCSHFLLFLDFFVVTSQFFFAGVHDNLAFFTVHDNMVAISNLVDAVFFVQANDGRNSTSLGDDNGMSRRGAGA